MSDVRAQSARLAAVLTDPQTAVAMALRTLDVRDAVASLDDPRTAIPAPLRERWRRCDADRLLDLGERCGARLVVPGDADWPLQLDALGPQRPWALWVRGPGFVELSQRRAVAVVGARSCTGYGERVASGLAADLARTGVPVVSGGAYGIDAAAHRGVLAVDGVTIAVLACGVDQAYPSAHAALFERIAERGAIVSEAPPGAHPTRPAFLIRNRLIAALSYGTVVVEARVRSGAISTFAHARSLCRVLMAVPGPVDSAESAGVHRLLQDDARLVTCAQDVLELTTPLGEAPPGERTVGSREWDDLSVDERLVHEVLPARTAVSLDVVLGRTGESMPTVLAALSRLAQRGLVAEELDGAWRRIRALRGADA